MQIKNDAQHLLLWSSCVEVKSGMLLPNLAYEAAVKSKACYVAHLVPTLE